MRRFGESVQCAVKMCWFHMGADSLRQRIADGGGSEGSHGEGTVEAFGYQGLLGNPARTPAAWRQRTSSWPETCDHGADPTEWRKGPP